MHGLLGRFGGNHGNWWQGLLEVKTPALVIAANHDTEDPAWACRALHEQLGSTLKQYICLGKAYGHQVNYGHVDMIVSKYAQKEVWPMIAHWLKHCQLEQPL